MTPPVGDEREGLNERCARGHHDDPDRTGQCVRCNAVLEPLDDQERREVARREELEARVGQLTQELRTATDELLVKHSEAERAERYITKLEAIMVAAGEMLGWMQKHHPKALMELPTPIYQQLRMSSLALSTSKRSPRLFDVIRVHGKLKVVVAIENPGGAELEPLGAVLARVLVVKHNDQPWTLGDAMCEAGWLSPVDAEAWKESIRKEDTPTR